MKASLLGHADLAENIQRDETPRETKTLVQSLNDTDLENWNTIKMMSMEAVI